jgi:hypothetical protein
VTSSYPRNQQPQHIGIPFIIMQHVQPDFIMVAQQSQQAWIIAQHSLSPLVQVMQTPISVGSHLHIPIVRLQQQVIIPLSIMQQLHIPPAIIVQRFCSIPAVTLSSQTQVIFIPPVHFSKVILHRGTIIMFMSAGAAAGPPIIPAVPGIPMPDIPMPGIPIPPRSVIMVVMLSIHPFSQRPPGATVRPPTSKSPVIMASAAPQIKT